MQKLVDKYSGTGEPKLTKGLEWTHKEFITLDAPVGVAIIQDTGERVETKRIAIHYGKRGTHVVPVKEEAVRSNYDG